MSSLSLFNMHIDNVCDLCTSAPIVAVVLNVPFSFYATTFSKSLLLNYSSVCYKMYNVHICLFIVPYFVLGYNCTAL